MSFLSEVFSKKMREIRQKMGLTQAEASALLETDQGNISRWESGKHIPVEETLQVIEEKYGVNSSNFYGDKYECAELILNIIKILPALDRDDLDVLLSQAEAANRIKSNKNPARGTSTI
jgi:transcriptional regulator with XRE-family HTH domain